MVNENYKANKLSNLANWLMNLEIEKYKKRIVHMV
jgi:hypothetical protein